MNEINFTKEMVDRIVNEFGFHSGEVANGPIHTRYVNGLKSDHEIKTWMIGKVPLESIKDMTHWHGFSEEQFAAEITCMLLMDHMFSGIDMPWGNEPEKYIFVGYKLCFNVIEVDSVTLQPMKLVKLRCEFVKV